MNVAQYIGINKQYKVEKSNWDQLDHICAFLLRLVYARTRFEEAENKKKNPGFASESTGSAVMAGPPVDPYATYFPWQRVGRWAAAHVLFAMLYRFQNEYAKDFMKSYPMNYLKEYRAAERGGGVNPVVAPPKNLPVEVYAQRLTESAASYFGWWYSYFRAIP